MILRDVLSVFSALDRIRLSARALSLFSANDRNRILSNLQQEIRNHRTSLLAANEKDMAALAADADPAFRDRLQLTDRRVDGILASIQEIIDYPDSLGEVVESGRFAKSGLEYQKIRWPLGVLFMIFESRPNVAFDAFSLAIRSGNAIILRGGKEACHTLRVIYGLFANALKGTSVSDAFIGLEDPSREIAASLLKEKGKVDVVIPRGGERLIDFVLKNTRIPVLLNDKGLCHIFVDATADLASAVAIVENAKCQRPGVCNSMETLLIHASVAERLIPLIYEKLSSYPVQWNGCGETLRLLSDKPNVRSITPSSYDTEYLRLEMNCRVVPSLDAAIQHIRDHGSHHSESILTQLAGHALRFQKEVDAAAVYWNASTRFTDGGEFGLGAEIGISTQKLHARGPIGLRELTSLRYWIKGEGTVRS